MREIKFRAWHKKDKFMSEPFSLGDLYGYEGESNTVSLSHPYGGEGQDNNITIAEHERGNPTYPQITEDNYNGINPNITILQYTGLKDKQDKEIYEGDIVCYDGDLDNEDARWVIKWVDEIASFQLGDDIPIDAVEHLIILGNIYENPEYVS